MITVTNNSGGGQPVSMANIEAVREVTRAARHPVLSGCLPFRGKRLVHPRSDEPGYADLVAETDRAEDVLLADGCTFSAKKDAFANIGGLLCTNDARVCRAGNEPADPDRGLPDVRRACRARPGSHRGGTGRGAAAGLSGVSDRLDCAISGATSPTMACPSWSLRAATPSISTPAACCRTSRSSQFPGQALAVELYRHAGVRSVEIGSVMFGEKARHELLRLAIPRRVYTQSHIDYLVEAILEVNAAARTSIRGFEIV